MSVSHCMRRALAIALRPRADWKEAIAELPEACPRTDCTGGVGCRKRVADYLRMQWRMLDARSTAVSP